MKILHVITSLHTGGAEKLMVDLLPLMKSEGHEVELLVFDGTPTPFMQQISDNGITIHSLSAGGNIYNPINIIRLTRFIRKYDIIHTHNTACQLFTPIAKVLTLGGAKLVTTEHNTTNRRRDKWYFKPLDRWMYKQYAAIIAISEKASILLKEYINPKNLLTINNGIKVKQFAEAQPLCPSSLIPNYDENDIILTMVAGFREQKNQDCVIRALTHLPSNYKLCLVGDGIRRPALEKLISDLKLNSRISLLGIRSDIPQILKTSHICILASHWEGLSLSSVEGMASGRPFLASDVDGLREVVDGNGILFDDGNDILLADKIKGLIDNPNLYAEIGRKCANAALQYDIQLTADKYLQLYHSL